MGRKRYMDSREYIKAVADRYASQLASGEIAAETLNKLLPEYGWSETEAQFIIRRAICAANKLSQGDMNKQKNVKGH